MVTISPRARRLLGFWLVAFATPVFADSQEPSLQAVTAATLAARDPRAARAARDTTRQETDASCEAPEALPELPAPFVASDLNDPDGHALASFYSALSQAAQGTRKARVTFFGDSHTAADLLTGRLRSRLQARFGSAGAGLIMPARPIGWYMHSLFELQDALPNGWTPVSAGTRTASTDARVGLSGFALTATNAAELVLKPRADARVASQADSFELYYLRRSGGGRLEVSLDGKVAAMVDTNAAREELGILPLHTADAQHTLALRAPGNGVVTVFGVASERNATGVVVDTLGIVGARVREQLRWNESLFAQQLQARNPDLVVLAYGTNEATDEDPIANYERGLRDAFARVRKASPQAACLLVGPSDHPERVGKRFRARVRTAQIIAVQRKLAAAEGCGFFDLVRTTGGPLSMRRLEHGSPRYGAGDHVHFTRAGYQALGDALSAALLRGYASWQHARCDSSGASSARLDAAAVGGH